MSQDMVWVDIHRGEEGLGYTEQRGGRCAQTRIRIEIHKAGGDRSAQGGLEVEVHKTGWDNVIGVVFGKWWRQDGAGDNRPEWM